MKLQRVLIADDHELILSSIKKILIDKFSILPESITVCTTPDDVIFTLEKIKYDLYLLDLEYKNKPPMYGYNLIEDVRNKYTDAKIIVYTMYDDIWVLNRLLELNVNGVICKVSTGSSFEQGISSVLKDEYYLCPTFKEVKSTRTTHKELNLNGITKRELEVLRYIADGYTSREIGEHLNISENGVENHRKNLFIKLNVTNVVQLVVKAINYGLIKPG